MTLIASPPTQDSLIQIDEQDPARKEPFIMAKSWVIWFLESLIPRLQQSGQTVFAPGDAGGTLKGQNASIPATPLPFGNLPAGNYRITWYARVTTVDGVSSSLTVAIGWVEDGTAITLPSSPLNWDTVSPPMVGSMMIPKDANSPITYATTYASNTPGQMKYKLAFLVEGPFE